MKDSLLKTRRFLIFQNIFYFLPQFLFSFLNKCFQKIATFLQIILLVCKLPRYYGIRNWVTTRKMQICMRTNLRYANWNRTNFFLGLHSHWWIFGFNSPLWSPDKFGAVDFKKIAPVDELLLERWIQELMELTSKQIFCKLK